MAGFYAEMQEMASELLADFKQGVVSLKRTITGELDPAKPWEPGAPTVTSYPLDATVRRVEHKYVDGTLIVATDNQVTFAVPIVEPAMSDVLVIDGDEHVIKDLRPLPAAGTAVWYIAFVAG